MNEAIHTENSDVDRVISVFNSLFTRVLIPPQITDGEYTKIIDGQIVSAMRIVQRIKKQCENPSPSQN
jgi:hypothetical protein